MTFYDRYIGGETEKVYEEIYSLKQDAFLPENFSEIQKVLTETFERTAYNLEVIYGELKKIDYLFKTEFEYNFQRPLIKPLENTEELLSKLDQNVRPLGYVPLSLKMFYRIVGACNFGWDYDTNEDFIWQCADLIQIVSLDDLQSHVSNEYWASDMKDGLQKHYKYPFLEVSADYLHKDNISGGPAYAIQITTEPSIDGLLLEESHNTTFINYLRICFRNCGFPRITLPEYKNEYQAFFATVKPRLKEI
ncbi:hypothetical protein WSM22_36140 [Cytophagales bacterium WSM2-2]|nr:hypothetical protein WSM22_36140 [Cytophagales bacterium WSM2-2]